MTANPEKQIDIYTDADAPGDAVFDLSEAGDSSRAGKTASKRTSSKSASTKSNAQTKSPTVKTISLRQKLLSQFKTVGRCQADPVAGLSLHWSCSSIAFRLDCEGDIQLQFKKSRPDSVWVEIYVDNTLVANRTEIIENGLVTVAKDLPKGIHSVKIVRQTDCEAPLLTLEAVRTAGELADPPPNNKWYIEAVGDSALIGWGVLLPDSFYAPGFSQAQARQKCYEDGTLSYPYLAAEKLNADCYILAKQGAGVAATYHPDKATYHGSTVTVGSAVNGLLPNFYALSIHATNYKYDFSRKADVIVFDGGGADVDTKLLSQVLDGDTYGITPKRAKDITVDFFLEMKRNNPDAKVIWCYGQTTNSTAFKNHVRAVLADLGGEAGGYYALEMPHTTRGDGYPSKEEYAAAAELLCQKLRTMGIS